jgi:hypothetical protein
MYGPGEADHVVETVRKEHAFGFPPHLQMTAEEVSKWLGVEAGGGKAPLNASLRRTRCHSVDGEERLGATMRTREMKQKGFFAMAVGSCESSSRTQHLHERTEER